jgi:hypothetical protein
MLENFPSLTMSLEQWFSTAVEQQTRVLLKGARDSTKYFIFSPFIGVFPPRVPQIVVLRQERVPPIS